MKKSLSCRQFAGFIFTAISGVLLHFLYEWSNKNRFAALISGVNESTWEHMKLLFFPLFFFAVIEARYIGQELKGFWYIKLNGSLLGLILIPVLFYTLNGIFGKTPSWVNITIFFVAAAAAYIYETSKFKKPSSFCLSNKTALFFLLCIACIFVIFTFTQPKIPLFMDPVTGTYGII